jgi:hypothetical protein
VALLVGAFTVSSSLAGAQTPAPSDTPVPQTQPAPGDDSERTPRDGKECDKDGDGVPDSTTGTGSGVRGRGGARSFAQ